MTTNAQALLSLALLSRRISSSVSTLAEGVWNPNFNNADGSVYMYSVADDVRRWLAEVDARLDKGRAS